MYLKGYLLPGFVLLFYYLGNFLRIDFILLCTKAQTVVFKFSAYRYIFLGCDI